jgi:hypothetical protein
LPGGKGTLGISGEPNDCTNGLSNPSMRKTGSGAVYKTYAPVAEGVIDTQTPQADHRGDVQCWNAAGRALYFVDVETGKSIKTLYKDASGQELIFPSPMVGNPIMFQSDVGTLGSRAFITDQDGVIWRIDISSSQQVEDQPLEGWTARPFHDIFWDRTPSSGQPSYEAPILSVDTDGRLVVLAGTGDTDNFTNATAENRVVSLTEVLAAGVVEPTGPEDYRAAINWEKRVKPNDGFAVSELVTGSMGLFNGQLFFGTFIPFSGSGNACDLGRGRIFAVNYLQHDENDLNPSTPQTWGPTVVDAAGSTQADSVINVPVSGAAENFMVMGLGVTQRPSCVSLDTGKYDVLSQSLQTVSQVAEPAVYLVAQASGDKSVGSLAQNRSGSELGSMELRLQKSTSVSRVTSWATSVD